MPANNKIPTPLQISRRALLQTGGGLTLSVVGRKLVNASTGTKAGNESDTWTGSEPTRTAVWPQTTYRRHLVDTDIPDWDPVFLSHFDASKFVGAMAQGGCQALMFYANSHVGLTCPHS